MGYRRAGESVALPFAPAAAPAPVVVHNVRHCQSVSMERAVRHRHRRLPHRENGGQAVRRIGVQSCR
jgi:hypothetical protein